MDTIEPISDAFFNPLYEKLKMYYVTGGCRNQYSCGHRRATFSAMQEALSDILSAYERDFASIPISMNSKDLYDLEIHTVPTCKGK